MSGCEPEAVWPYDQEVDTVAESAVPDVLAPELTCVLRSISLLPLGSSQTTPSPAPAFRNDARAPAFLNAFRKRGLDPAATDERSVVCQSLGRTDP
jgi:hypothetical protein